MKLTVAVLVTISPLFTAVKAVNPGFRSIITQKGLDYVNQVGFPILKEKLRNLTIPPITTSYKTGVITVNATFSNVVITSLDFGESSLSSDVKGVVLIDDGASLSISGDWSYKELNWPHLKDHGSVDISGHSISLSVSADLKENKTSGGVRLNSTSCSFSIGSLKVHFHGGASWLYNLFSLVIEDELKKFINDKVCAEATQIINTLGNTMASSLPVVWPVGNLVEVSYALVSDPDFSHTGHIVTDHKGEFLLTANPQEPPFVPPPLPDPSGKFSKMIYIQASSYVAETASYAFWKAGYMAYNISSNKIPSYFRKTTYYCNYILDSQELCKKFPDKDVMFGIVASDYPRLEVTEKYAVMHARANASMYVDNDGREELAFTLALSLQADMRVTLNQTSEGQYLVCGNVSNPRINVSLAISTFGKFNASTLENTITTLAPDLGLGVINEYANAGLPIPMAEGAYFTGPSLAFGKGYVEVSGDVAYKPDYLKKLRSLVP